MAVGAEEAKKEIYRIDQRILIGRLCGGEGSPGLECRKRKLQYLQKKRFI